MKPRVCCVVVSVPWESFVAHASTGPLARIGSRVSRHVRRGRASKRRCGSGMMASCDSDVRGGRRASNWWELCRRESFGHYSIGRAAARIGSRASRHVRRGRASKSRCGSGMIASCDSDVRGGRRASHWWGLCHRKSFGTIPLVAPRVVARCSSQSWRGGSTIGGAQRGGGHRSKNKVCLRRHCAWIIRVGTKVGC